ncbi:MAG: hypothetical protein UD575_16285 [Oscillospiraceae bacterium]|nr:hypothetical protein [Oscillospiraceae bacterium]
MGVTKDKQPDGCPTGGVSAKGEKPMPVDAQSILETIIGLQHCRYGMSWKCSVGFFERVRDMVFALNHKVIGKKTRQVPIIRRAK